MDEGQRVQFDVGCALATLSGDGHELPFGFPEKLQISGVAKRVLNDCVDPDSFERSSCRIRENLSSSESYHLRVGSDTLTLCPGGEIHLGGSGVTVPLYDKGLNRHYALKVPRASVLAYAPPDFSTLYDKEHLHKRIGSEYNAFDNERQISRRLSHENIAQHFFGSSRVIPGIGSPGYLAQLSFSVSEWIDGARPLHKFLAEEKPTLKEIISLLTNTFSALAHIHAQEVIHWDIKCDNILVSKNRIAKIIDFGNAKLLDVKRDD